MEEIQKREIRFHLIVMETKHNKRFQNFSKAYVCNDQNSLGQKIIYCISWIGEIKH